MRRIFDLKEKDVISIVGAGGKTSVMFALAEDMRKDFKVLVTTTTKIFIPLKVQYDYMNIGESRYLIESTPVHNGIYVYGEEITNENKISGLEPGIIDKCNKDFDFTLIESDGSKMKPLKGWREDEPIICSLTTKTIGVFDITTISSSIEEKLIHRVEEFLNITGARLGEQMNINYAANLIQHSQGLFKGSKGKRILFINKVECKEDRDNSLKLVYYINKIRPGYLEQVVLGSIREYKFESLD